MNNINLFALGLLLAFVLLDVALLLYVLPKNWRELRRQKNEYSIFRLVIFNVTTSIILFSLIPIAYQVSRLNVPAEHVTLFRALASSSTALLVLSFMVGWVSIHVIGDILVRRDNRKGE